MDEVVEFIQRRFGNTDANWQDGNCYYMALILTQRFPYLKIYYEPIDGHFLAGTPSRYYDSIGRRRDLASTPILFDQLKSEDSLWAERIMRDCIL